MKNIEELKQLLDQANREYYLNDNSIMSDAEYDALEKEYEVLAGEKYYSGFVPGGVAPDMSKVVHKYPIRSLDKVKEENELIKYLKKLGECVVEHKLDGLTIVDYYGETYATRGSGEVGEDVTNNVKVAIGNLKPHDYIVRMEMYVTYENFEKMNEIRRRRGEEEYKNLRNAVSGILRQKDRDDELLKLISYQAYNIVGSTLSEVDQVALLKELGYETVSILHHIEDDRGIDEAVRLITNYHVLGRPNLPYEIDGLVIKSNIENSIQVFGSTAHHDNNAVAYKFPSEGIWTTLEDIRWTVGRTGKVVPNAVIKPVNLMNSTVSRATLHNASMIDRLGLAEKCEVLITKCNDVIPGVVGCRSNTGNKFSEPTKCPVCGTTLDRVDSKDNEGVYQLYCNNIECGAKTVLRTVHMAQKSALNIVGLAEETVQKMYDDMLIEEPYHVFGLTCDEIICLEGFARASGQKLYKAIQGARTADLDRFLYAGGIPLVGKSTCELIAKELGSFAEVLKDIKLGCPKIGSIPGVGDSIVQSIIRNHHVWISLSDFVTPVDMKKQQVLENALTFVITGTLEKKRSYYEDLIKQHGHKVSGSVSKKTDYLLAGESAGSKLDKANEYGVNIIHTESELLDILTN